MDIIEHLRDLQLEKAKGELRALYKLYYTPEHNGISRYNELKSKIEKFIEELEYEYG